MRHCIKAAQEREALQRAGDDLDGKIRKAEKEVRALEATLGKLNQKNSAFRSSFRRVEVRRRCRFTTHHVDPVLKKALGFNCLKVSPLSNV